MVLLSLDVEGRAVTFDRSSVEVQTVTLHDVPCEFADIELSSCEALEPLQVVMLVLHCFFALVLADLAVREEVVDGRA